MKSFALIALFSFLDSIQSLLVQDYSPKGINNHHEGIDALSSRSSPGYQHVFHDDRPHFRPPRDMYYYYYSKPYVRVNYGVQSSWDDSSESDSASNSRDSDEDIYGNVRVIINGHDYSPYKKRPCKRPTKKTPSTVGSSGNIALEATTSSLELSTPIGSTGDIAYRTTTPFPDPSTTAGSKGHIKEKRKNNNINIFVGILKSSPEPSKTVGSSRDMALETTTSPELSTTIGSAGNIALGSINSSPDHSTTVSPTGDIALITTTYSPSTTTEGLTSFSPQILNCIESCSLTNKFHPVCGTNGETYDNEEKLVCAKSCGVEVLCEKPCNACGNTIVISTTEAISPTKKKILKPNIKECVDACPDTLASDPVCGTDQVMYRNPTHLLCAQQCGVSVEIDRLSSCLPTATYPHLSTTTTSEFPTSTITLNHLTCLTRCPEISEYSPVCGTDNLTYSNPGYLECAKLCGIEVELKQNSPCVATATQQISQTINGNREEVSTVLSQSTATTTILFTSPTSIESMTPQSTLMTTTAPVSSTKLITILKTIAVPISTTPTVSKSTSTAGFSIPSYILNNILGSTTTTLSPPITIVPNPDNDEIWI